MTHDMTPAAGAGIADSAPPFGALPPLSSRVLFWRARFLCDSPALHHLPLLFWLVEAVRPRLAVGLGLADGAGYFALCQAADRLDPGCRCLGFGSWAQTDRDGPGRVPDALAAHNARFYEDLSRIEAAALPGLAARVGDGTVDLLWLDGPRSAADHEALLHDWPRKMSERGVIVLHGLDTHLADAAGRALVARLRGHYPAIAFPGGDGLLVVLYGPRQGARLQALAALGRDEAAAGGVQAVFARLGWAQRYEWQARTATGAAAEAEARATAAEAALDAVRADLARVEAAYDARHDQIARLQARMFDREAALEARAEAAEARIGPLEADLAREGARADTAEADRDRHAAEADRRARALAEAGEAAAAERERAEATEADRDRHAAGAAEARARIATLEADLARAAKDAAEAGEAAAAARARAEAAEADRDRHAAEAAGAAEARARIATLEADLARAAKNAAATTAGTDATRAAEARAAKAEARAAAQHDSLTQRFAEIARLTEALEAAEAAARKETQSLRAEAARRAEAQARAHAEEMARMAAHWQMLLDLRAAQARLHPGRDPFRGTGLPALREQVQTLKSSPEFDPKWYLETYKDVRDGGMDPALHYLRFGTYEGRNPGPGFDTLAHYAAHPEAVRRGLCALVHARQTPAGQGASGQTAGQTAGQAAG